MAPDRGVEDPGTWRDDRLSVRVGLDDGAKQTSKVTGVIMHSNCPDGWQGHRARMALADSDAKAPSLVSSIPEPKTVATAPLAFTSWESDAWTLAVARSRLGVGGKGSAQIDSSLFKDLCSDLVPPCQTSYLLGGRPVAGDGENPPSCFGLLPGVERVDEIESRPGHRYRRIDPACGKSIGHQLQRLVVGEPRRSRMSHEGSLLGRGRIQGEAECRVPHGGWQAISPV